MRLLLQICNSSANRRHFQACFTAIRASAIPNTAVSRNRPRIWVLQEVVFRSRTTPSAFFDWRTSTSRRSVAWVNTSVGFLLSEPLRSRGKVESLNAFQVWRFACNGQKAKFELAHCRVNVESE